jgi:hypothetical protein
VEDSPKAFDILNEAGYMTRMTKVLGARISDDCGGLDSLLKALLECNINVDYIYISYDRNSKSVIAIFDAEAHAEVEEAMRAKGFQMM